VAGSTPNGRSGAVAGAARDASAEANPPKVHIEADVDVETAEDAAVVAVAEAAAAAMAATRGDWGVSMMMALVEMQ
jgi:translation initiation factor 2 alpha subunit (eIF-2alpha)